MGEELNDRQMQLLADILALQNAGMIQGTAELFAYAGYDAGSTYVDQAPTVTWRGEDAIAAWNRREKGTHHARD